MSSYGDDVEKYIQQDRENIRLIDAAADDEPAHTDLITYIFEQLKLLQIIPFHDTIQRWHIDYLEAKLPDLTPTKLLKQADDKVQILKHVLKG